jgi:pyruvate dehydrogenase E2 component (dihydrolipoamide acetyltransferase)
MTDFLMPALGADMTTGELVQWHVKPGDTVRRGDVVAVVETHKGAIDVEVFLDGVIDELAPLHVPLPVGARLARVRGRDEAGAEGAVRVVAEGARATAAVPRTPSSAASPAVPVAGAAAKRGDAALRRQASPAARRRARELQVVLDTLTGTGPGGAIRLADVERARRGSGDAAAVAVEGARAAGASIAGAAAQTAAGSGAATGETAPRTAAFDPAAMRLAIGNAMARSKREIPHYYLSEPVPMRRALDWLRAHNEAVPVSQRLLPVALLIKAVARALLAVPGLNGHHIDGAFKPAGTVHAGMAIRLRGGGLIAPALHDAQDQPLPQLMAALASLVQRARSGGLRSSELTDPTVTVTALGEQGATAVFGVIHPPQVALIGFGRVRERAWVESGQVVAMPVIEAGLSADHRASDGLTGSAFLTELSAQLQQPEAL